MRTSTHAAPDAGVMNPQPRSPGKPRLILHVGVTGHMHEDLKGCDLDAVRSSIAAILVRLEKMVTAIHAQHRDAFRPERPLLRMFSRLADGSDLLVAEEATRLGFELHCPLPFAADVYQRGIAPGWLDLYKRMLQTATHVVELDGDAAALNESYFESRRMVLRHSDVLIAIWDPVHRLSQVWGTTRLVDEARHDDLLVVHIDPSSPGTVHLDVREEDADIHKGEIGELEERLRSLLTPPTPAERSRWPWPPAPPYEAFLDERQRSWSLGFVWLPFRDFWHKGLIRKPQLHVADFLATATQEWTDGWNATPALPEPVRDSVDQGLLPPFAWTDKLADYYANLTRSSIILNYLMAAAAVLLALAGHALGPSCIAAEFVLIVIIVGNTLVGNHLRWHERWIDYRVLAERLRLQRFLAPLGRITSHTRRPAHLSFSELRGSWLAWYFRAVVRELGMVGERYDAGYVEACRAVMLRLTGEKDSGQIGWHRSNAARFAAIEKHLEWAGLFLFIATGSACAAHLIYHQPLLTLVTAALPAFGAALAAIAVHLQLDRIAKHSESMAEHLGKLAVYLKRQPAQSRKLGPPLEQIAQCMTSEVLDWRTLFRTEFRPPS